jgi:hypothetical protein
MSGSRCRIGPLSIAHESLGALLVVACAVYVVKLLLQHIERRPPSVRNSEQLPPEFVVPMFF